MNRKFNSTCEKPQRTLQWSSVGQGLLSLVFIVLLSIHKLRFNTSGELLYLFQKYVLNQ